MDDEELEDELEDEEEYEEEEDDEDINIVQMIKEEIRDLVRERKKFKPTSETYMVLTQRITEATEQLRNAEEAENDNAQKICAIRNKNAALWQTLGGVVGNIAGNTIGALFNRSNVKTVVGCENEGGIVKSTAMKFVK